MDNDNAIAGDPTALPHLLPPPAEHPATVAEFAALIAGIAEDGSCWRPLVRYDAASRWYHRLLTGPGYEVWLLSWVPGQGSGRHDHGRSSGVCAVLSGALTESAAGRGERVLTPGSMRAFAPGYVHEMVNVSLEPAVSLHVYFPGLTEMRMHPRLAASGRSAGEEPVPRATLTC
ncbi:cysteine dioxygenase [Streptomyces radicis]|uniref:Cupin domain-containing protein n=1 Tax=Streptomyces radicis TaxID=1750517 RepID=A0A3A9WRI5_9ACTN|nr:cysteine dioxygenase family protein [Streptomyces radicis]RKN08747.1 cupin domain-containing protein [Streptomyces radicis]RKN21905.1 cupin domain-containing protein [Streptomyces radicis]